MKKGNLPLILLTAAIAIAVVVAVGLLTQLHVPGNSPVETRLDAVVATEMILTETALAETALAEPTAEPAAATQTEATLQPTAAAVDPYAYFRAQISPESYLSWIRKLSGAEPVNIGGIDSTIETRYSYAMFTGQENAKAFEFLLETIRQWILESQITVEPYIHADAVGSYTWNNIIITFPGQTKPDEQVLFTAHFDSCVVFEGDPMQYAPGANDNGTGMATMLEALRIFSKMQFERTLKVVLFSGEENFQQGSTAYVEQHAGDHIIGVINMDMYGTDKDGDRCFELYVGGLPGSQELANAFLQTIAEHDLKLKADYLTTNAYAKADQKPFWDKQIPAVTAMENFLSDYTPGGCETGMDRTDCWHLPCDTVEKINQSYAFDIGLAGTFTAMKLAGVLPVMEP